LIGVDVGVHKGYERVFNMAGVELDILEDSVEGYENQ